MIVLAYGIGWPVLRLWRMRSYVVMNHEFIVQSLNIYYLSSMTCRKNEKVDFGVRNLSVEAN